jgi:hypothetical protein
VRTLLEFGSGFPKLGRERRPVLPNVIHDDEFSGRRRPRVLAVIVRLYAGSDVDWLARRGLSASHRVRVSSTPQSKG